MKSILVNECPHSVCWLMFVHAHDVTDRLQLNYSEQHFLCVGVCVC